jgi:hypothetical protein
VTDAVPSKELIDKSTQLAERRLTLGVQRSAIQERHAAENAARAAEQAKELGEVDAEIKQVDTEMWEMIDTHRADLIPSDKKSFMTGVAKYQLASFADKTEVDDAKGIMKLALKRGVVRQIAVMKITWNFNQAKFFAWLDKQKKEVRDLFEPFLKKVPAYETLHIQPNTGYVVEFDNKRVSPPSTKIIKS